MRNGRTDTYLTAFGFSQQHDTVQELEEVEEQTRLLSGFERFQLPLSSNEYMELAKSGPIVSFNITDIRSDAIIVTESEIKTITLPDLRYDDLTDNIFLMQEPFTLRGRAEKNRQMRDTL